MIIYNIKVKLALLSLALIVVLESQSSSARTSLPNQLHCAAEVYYQNENTKTFDLYEVDEYVDWSGTRSSLQMRTVGDGKSSIYYNQLTPPGGSSSRKFMVYEVDKNTCKSSSINSWPLSKIRKILISMLPMQKLDRKVCDIALGPSALLMAIEQSENEFRFLRQTFNRVRLTHVDIYMRRIDAEADLKVKDVSLIVTVLVVSQRQPEAKLRGTSLLDRQKVDFIEVTICKVANSKLNLAPTNKEYKCTDEEILIDVDYFILAERMVGSLTGRSLDESSNFDYHRDPFMRPIGIGCWKDYDYANQRKFPIPSLQFSAEYTTTNGTIGFTYVAYDGYRRLLRFDREDRKSIYDLDRGQSYHVNTLSSMRDPSEPIASSCIVMDIEDERLNSPNAMKRLIGIGPKPDTHYMGTKIIDHVAYDVFEAELDYDDILDARGLPIIMESTNYVVQDNKTKRFFMTYYVHDDQGTMGTVGTFRDDDSRTTFESSMAPKFVELWEVIGTAGQASRRTLINRLEFTEFSWSLEVQPNDDPDSQDLSHLFYMKSCAQVRSTQWQVRFRVSQNTGEDKSQLSESQLVAFRANKQLIEEVFQNELANTLDISRLQIAQMSINFLQKSADLLVDARLVELQSGISDDKMLGFGKFLDTMSVLKDYIRSFRYNRHSLESCRLDSIAQAKTNSYMFCGALTICVVFDRKALTNSKLELEIVKDPDVGRLFGLDANCEVHQYDWAPNSVPREDSLAARVRGNIYELAEHPFVVKFRYTEPDKLTQFAKFTGHSHAIKVKRLDSVGLEDSKSPLMGLRFATIMEEPRARNLNMPVKLAPKIEDKFNHCQMACQMDDYCESFSVCIRKQATPIQESDCILAALKLTSERVEPLSKILRGNKTEDELEIRESEKIKSQVFRFKRDPDCNIHPKDIISSYKISDTIRIAPDSPSDVALRPPMDGGPELDRVLSLEDCAAESFESGRQMNSIDSNFTFCPLNSICMPNKRLDQIMQSAAATPGQLCNLYRKSHTQFYATRLNTRLSIIIDDSAKADQASLANISRSIEGLDLEGCARDCNLRRSNCLAFDSCLSKGALKLCILYSIRSPMSRANNKRLGLLPQEEPFYGNEGKDKTSSNAAILTGNLICNHYALRRVYFDIRLQQLLAGDRLDGLAQREELDEMEDSIIIEDQRRGEEALGNVTSDHTSGLEAGETTATSGENNFYLLLFLLGLILACMGFINAGGASIWLMDSWERIKTKHRLRKQGHRLSQLALANNVDV